MKNLEKFNRHHEFLGLTPVELATLVILQGLLTYGVSLALHLSLGYGL